MVTKRVKESVRVAEENDIKVLGNFVNWSPKREFFLTGDLLVEERERKFVEKTHNPFALCYIAKYTDDPKVLNTILKKSNSFDKSTRLFIVMNIAGNKDTFSLTLDEIARGNYPVIAKMNIVTNPSTWIKTVQFLTIHGEDEGLRKIAKNFLSIQNIGNKLRK